MTESKSDLPIPPGELLQEVLAERGWSSDDLADCSGDIHAILTDQQPITPDIAKQLEDWLGVPAHIWLGMENEYRETLERLKGGA